MIYAQIDDQRDRQELQQAMQEAKQSKWYRRLKIIDLSSRGYKVLHLAQMFDLSAATIRQYIKCYNTDGLNGLHPQYGAGRRPKIDWSKEQWADVLKQAPSQFESWTVGLRIGPKTCSENTWPCITIYASARGRFPKHSNELASIGGGPN